MSQLVADVILWYNDDVFLRGKFKGASKAPHATQ